jgi:hypothetical protein
LKEKFSGDFIVVVDRPHSRPVSDNQLNLFFGDSLYRCKIDMEGSMLDVMLCS